MGQLQKLSENWKIYFVLDFDDFRDLEADEQAKHMHMHMHMICLPEIIGISEIVKIEQIEHFQIFLYNFYLDVISLRRKYRPSTKTFGK